MSEKHQNQSLIMGSEKIDPPEQNEHKQCQPMEACGRSMDLFGEIFARYGRLVSRHPYIFICIPILVCGLLGIGILNMSHETNIETLYVPQKSRTASEREKVEELFPDKSDVNYFYQSLSKMNLYGRILFKSKNGEDLFSSSAMAEINDIVARVQNISVLEGNYSYKYSDVCARTFGRCTIDGEELLQARFLNQYYNNGIQYPMWPNSFGFPINLTNFINGQTNDAGNLQKVNVFKITFNLRQTDEEKSKAWELAFIEYMKTVETNLTEIAFAAYCSLNEEIKSNTGTGKDITWFSLSFSMLITYASLVVSGGDCVSNRGHLARAGVVGVGLSILAAFGLLSAVELRFVDIVGVMPFLVLGVGVDAMFVILSEWSSCHSAQSVEEQMGETLRGCGGAISIASLTDVTAFLIGVSSPFISIRNFCAYTGVALLFSFFCHITFFLGCLTLHGRRVKAQRHCVTCLRAPDKKQPQEEGFNPWHQGFCAGEEPQTRKDDESLCEKVPTLFLTKLIRNIVFRISILVCMLVYLGVSIWGVLNLKQGLLISNLLSDDSYLQKYDLWSLKYFPSVYQMSLNFENVDVRNPDHIDSMLDLFSRVRQEDYIADDSLLCWYQEYTDSMTNMSTPETYFSNLQFFLQFRPYISNDVRFTPTADGIEAFRCHVSSVSVPDTNEQGQMMLRLREICDDSNLDVFVYSPPFIFFEQYVIILPTTLQTVGIAVACMFFITVIFMPHPFMVVLVTLNMVSILLGIFGFLYLWDLTLSSITMIHLIMSVGFSVDFSVHVCHGFMMSDKEARIERVIDALSTSTAPVINGGISSLLGMMTLLASKSYVFQSFFKIMVLVICFGLLHSMLLLPVILSLIGPKGRPTDTKIILIEPDKNTNSDTGYKQVNDVKCDDESIANQESEENKKKIIVVQENTDNVNSTKL